MQLGTPRYISFNISNTWITSETDNYTKVFDTYKIAEGKIKILYGDWTGMFMTLKKKIEFLNRMLWHAVKRACFLGT